MVSQGHAWPAVTHWVRQCCSEYSGHDIILTQCDLVWRRAVQDWHIAVRFGVSSLEARELDGALVEVEVVWSKPVDKQSYKYHVPLNTCRNITETTHLMFGKKSKDQNPEI